MTLGPGDEQAPSAELDDDDEDDAHLYGWEEGYDPRDVMQWETDDEIRAECADMNTRAAYASRGERCDW